MRRALDEANVSAANVKALHAGRGQKHQVMLDCGAMLTRNPAEMGKLLKSVLK